MSRRYDLTKSQVNRLAKIIKSKDKLLSASFKDSELVGLFKKRNGDEYEDTLNDLLSVDDWVDVMNDYSVNEEYNGELNEAYSVSLDDIARSIKATDYNNFDESKINEGAFPHEMRFKRYYNYTEGDKIILEWVTQEPYSKEDLEIFKKEVIRAFEYMSYKKSYTKPFDLEIRVVARDYSNDFNSWDKLLVTITPKNAEYDLIESLDNNEQFTIYMFNKDDVKNGESEYYIQKTVTCPENKIFTIALGIIDPENFKDLIENETDESTLETICSDIILDADWNSDDSFIFAIHNDTKDEWVCGDIDNLEYLTNTYIK